MHIIRSKKNLTKLKFERAKNDEGKEVKWRWQTKNRRRKRPLFLNYWQIYLA